MYHIITNDFAVGTWKVANGGSAAQLAGYALRGAGLLEAAPKAALLEKRDSSEKSAGEFRLGQFAK